MSMLSAIFTMVSLLIPTRKTTRRNARTPAVKHRSRRLELEVLEDRLAPANVIDLGYVSSADLVMPGPSLVAVASNYGATNDQFGTTGTMFTIAPDLSSATSVTLPGLGGTTIISSLSPNAQYISATSNNHGEILLASDLNNPIDVGFVQSAQLQDSRINGVSDIGLGVGDSDGTLTAITYLVGGGLQEINLPVAGSSTSVTGAGTIAYGGGTPTFTAPVQAFRYVLTSGVVTFLPDSGLGSAVYSLTTPYDTSLPFNGEIPLGSTGYFDAVAQGVGQQQAYWTPTGYRVLTFGDVSVMDGRILCGTAIDTAHIYVGGGGAFGATIANIGVSDTGELLDTFLADHSITVTSASFVTQGMVYDGSGHLYILVQSADFHSRIYMVDIGITPADTTAPTVGLTSTPPLMSPGASATFVVSASDNVTPAAQIQLAGSIDGNPAAFTGNTANLSGLTNGPHTFSVTATDLAGNSSAPLNYAFTVDTVNPTASFGTPSSVLTRNTPVSFTVTFTDVNFDAASVSASDFQLVTTGTAFGTIGISGTGASRTVTVSNITGNGTIAVQLKAGSVLDLAGNSNSAVTSTAFAVDNSGPTITISGPVAAKGGSVQFTVSYADPNFASASLTLSSLTLNKTGTATGSLSLTQVNATTFVVTISRIRGDGTLGFTIAAGTGVDSLGNQSSAASSTTFTVRRGKAVIVAPLGAIFPSDSVFYDQGLSDAIEALVAALAAERKPR